MSPIIDSYHIAAKYYDGAYAAMRDLVDAPFYVELAKEYGGPVLEIGCGTGRVLLPTAPPESRFTAWTIPPQCLPR